MRLPRPRGAVYEVTGGMDVGTAWDLGLDAWTLRVGVSWDDEHDQLANAVASHMGLEEALQGELVAALADHGVEFDAFGHGGVLRYPLEVADLVDSKPERGSNFGIEPLLAAGVVLDQVIQLALIPETSEHEFVCKSGVARVQTGGAGGQQIGGVTAVAYLQ